MQCMSNRDLNPNLVISYHHIRLVIGWLGVSLPFILLIGNYIINNWDILNNDTFVMNQCYTYHSDNIVKSSISRYYYTTVGDLFTGILLTVALFLFTYRGYPQRDEELIPSDSFMTNLAGICALGAAIFPISSNYCIPDNVRAFISSEVIGYVHYIFEGFFLLSLSIISIFNFRRTAKIEDFGKMPSHDFYKYCGIVMLICLSLIVVYAIWIEAKFPALEKYNIILILETIAMLAFGCSWIKKGSINSN